MADRGDGGPGDERKRKRASRLRRPKRGDVIRGVFEGAKAAPEDEATASPPVPEPPVGLDDEGRRAWNHHTPILLRDPRFDIDRDREILAAFCLAWSRLVAAEKLIDEEGLTAPTADGSVKKHPAVAISNEALTLVKQYANELGLTPIARKRLPEQGTEKHREGKAATARKLLD